MADAHRHVPSGAIGTEFKFALQLERADALLCGTKQREGH
jgi:hypothetical protein